MVRVKSVIRKLQRLQESLEPTTLSPMDIAKKSDKLLIVLQQEIIRAHKTADLRLSLIRQAEKQEATQKLLSLIHYNLQQLDELKILVQTELDRVSEQIRTGDLKEDEVQSLRTEMDDLYEHCYQTTWILRTRFNEAAARFNDSLVHLLLRLSKTRLRLQLLTLKLRLYRKQSFSKIE